MQVKPEMRVSLPLPLECEACIAILIKNPCLLPVGSGILAPLLANIQMQQYMRLSRKNQKYLPYGRLPVMPGDASSCLKVAGLSLPASWRTLKC